MEAAPTKGRSDAIPIIAPLATHLRESAVLKMLQEEEGVNHIGSGHVAFGSWPPPGHDKTNRPMGFMTKVTRGAGGRPVEWPPRPELSRSQENLDQVARRRLPPTGSSRSQTPPPVPPRPANYPQAKMDQVQVQHQQQHQQMVMQQQQQQQQRQQVSSMQMKTVRQVQHYQTYEQQYGTEAQGSIQYQMAPQPTLQYHQMSQQQTTSSSSYPSAQNAPAGVEHHVPIQMATAPQQHHGPKHGVPTPFANQNSMMSPPQSANHNVFMTETPQEHAVPIQNYSNQNAHAPAPPQHNAYQNAGPYQYADAQHAQNAPQYAQNAPQHLQDTPQYASGTTQDNPDGYTTAYSTIRGEWPPKQHNDAPNLTTTYPSGFKLKDQAPYQTGPARVVTSQPAFKITQPIRRRGDDKWPPRGSDEPSQEEVREFIRPKKSNRNYEEFFAQNALPHNYAGYRPPPGTQHHGVEDEDVSGISEM